MAGLRARGTSLGSLRRIGGGDAPADALATYELHIIQASGFSKEKRKFAEVWRATGATDAAIGSGPAGAFDAAVPAIRIGHPNDLR